MRRLALLFALLPGLLPLALGALALGGCSQSYSPNTYASTAAQDEATVERGVIIGVREVLITANNTVAIAAGGAAGGVAGAQVPGSSVATALGAIGGSVVGGIGGAAAAKAVGNSKGWEYIVQEDGAKLVSVTQTSKMPLPIGQHVLVIADAQQARIVPDYTVQIAAAPANPETVKTSGTANGSTATEMNIGPLLPEASVEPLEVDPTTASNPTPPARPAAAADPATPTTPSAVTTTGAAANGSTAGAPATGPSSTAAPSGAVSTPPGNAAPAAAP